MCCAAELAGNAVPALDALTDFDAMVTQYGRFVQAAPARPVAAESDDRRIRPPDDLPPRLPRPRAAHGLRAPVAPRARRPAPACRTSRARRGASCAADGSTSSSSATGCAPTGSPTTWRLGSGARQQERSCISLCCASASPRCRDRRASASSWSTNRRPRRGVSLGNDWRRSMRRCIRPRVRNRCPTKPPRSRRSDGLAARDDIDYARHRGSGDIVAPDALAELALELAASPSTVLVYVDHDELLPRRLARPSGFQAVLGSVPVRAGALPRASAFARRDAVANAFSRERPLSEWDLLWRIAESRRRRRPLPICRACLIHRAPSTDAERGSRRSGAPALRAPRRSAASTSR